MFIDMWNEVVMHLSSISEECHYTTLRNAELVQCSPDQSWIITPRNCM